MPLTPGRCDSRRLVFVAPPRYRNTLNGQVKDTPYAKVFHCCDT
ncbi:MAG: hypothetical protein ACI85V_002496, partial [bacterium]